MFNSNIYLYIFINLSKRTSTSDHFNREIETTPSMSLFRTISTENIILSTQNQNVPFSTPSSSIEIPSDKTEVVEHSLCIEYENSSSDDTILG